ncbi:hypothetical protein SDC9_108728 [bioreactor metagenome]|uniref:Uncharacterized protein n=1 Tax=bioreactor metagenome TaxID=1076179 RepID=A0A645B8W6_9ZZZZ
MSRRDVAADVPFGNCPRLSTKLFFQRSGHGDEIDFFSQFRGVFQQQGQIGHRRDGDQGNRIGRILHDPADGGYGISGGLSGTIGQGHQFQLGERIGIRRRAGDDRNVAAVRRRQQLAGDFRAATGVSGGRGHQLQVQFRALEQKSQRPGVVDIAADIGVENNRDLHFTDSITDSFGRPSGRGPKYCTIHPKP